MHGKANVRMEFISTSSYAFKAWKGIILYENGQVQHILGINYVYIISDDDKRRTTN